MVDYISSVPKEAPGCVGPGIGTGNGMGTGPGTGTGSPPAPDAHHLRAFVGRTRGLLKSRLRSVLAGSNDLLSGLSTRLESALSLSTDTLSTGSSSSSSGSGTAAGGRRGAADGADADASAHATTTTDDAPASGPAAPRTPPQQSRAAAAAGAFSKKLRLPQLGHALSFEDYAVLARHKKRKERAHAQAQAQAQATAVTGARGPGASDAASDATTPTTPASPPHVGCRAPHANGSASGLPTSQTARSVSSGDSGGAGNRPRAATAPLAPHELQATGPDPYEKLHYRTEAPSSGSASDLDGYGPSTSLDSDQDGKKYWVRSGSEGSVQSWASSLSYESQSDEKTAEAVEFMRKFVSDLFKDSSAIPLDQKSKFGQLAQHEAGRLWFARFVNAQRVHHKKVDESTFYSLVQYFAIVLFECADADDFSPAKSLMNMCFTFYHEVDVPGCEPYKEYLYTYLREQTIWHSLRFWNAAFFDALQCERVHRPVVTRDDIQSNSLEAITDEKQYQENITFGQLGTFTYNMHAFGLSKELCSEFLRKQCVIANLSEDQEKILRDNVERMYRETDPWR